MMKLLELVLKCIKSIYVEIRKQDSRAKQLGTFILLVHNTKSILIGSLSSPNFVKQTAALCLMKG